MPKANRQSRAPKAMGGIKYKIDADWVEGRKPTPASVTLLAF